VVSVLPVIGILIFAGASFFFALAEAALFSLGKWRAQQLVETQPAAGRRLVQLLEQPQDLLATIVLGNTFANAGLVSTALWIALTGAWPVTATVAGVLMLVLLGCEVVPKTLAVRSPELWSARLLRPIVIVQAVVEPLRRIAQRMNQAILLAVVPGSVKPQLGMTDAEYRELLDMAYQQGALQQSEREIILRIIQLDRRAAKEVMRPRAQMACISDDLSVEEMVAAAREFKHRRIPIFDETPDTIVGILNTRVLLLDPQHNLEEAIEFPSFVPESMNLLQLFKSFQRQQRGLAIVLDEFGGTAGIVTMEDILEEVVGDLRTEGLREGASMEKLGEGRWRVDGTVTMAEFRHEHPALPEFPGVETMGGLLLTLAEVVPAQGESVVVAGLRLTAQSVDERRVREVLVEAVRS
jgi:CBS domain containing-hemolysin-like protein